MTDSLDRAFKALADPTRRRLLDSLRERNGQTLGALCSQLSMARQSATQHLGVLEEANLISVVWRGREKLHYLNPVPIHDIQQRWIAPFEHPRLQMLSGIKRQAEGHDMTAIPTFVYVTYIQSTPERVWHALTSADLTAEFWGHSNVSDWQPGSTWRHERTDGSGIADAVGRVLVAEPPVRLVLTFDDPDSEPVEGGPTVTFLIEPHHEIVRLTVTHENLPDADALGAISHGWPAVLANLKSLLEVGHALPQAPWEMKATR
ncbi:uncharacterized protein YndB with AHSA1/START domain [Allocatelliglobosispora scoriae]|uniref:Uncharacterized protein YndB with AHSA1/START domain n=1 Tax=Allocatelliglobosispora scoriae TaxID=643052 RepID=A0A841BM34_9ACTN|nr:SRPBCC domain-containing protein [Allocatelliglobosispora scoriae]MBB5867880.1 uncharacterized protein YndB with AHSA1/START domain [Allocatelliglobosispora scoriae]